ncbi:putative membrane protein [Sphingomonas sp. BE138]|uniref:DUF1624 domain-containing protein n=1 Tax=Sphingomonas sp. BE138 TaxID=2817845 RepID=UPI00285D8F27|nr:heparan-alpha-glucosaminide N-acetyltransferase domain-containing protein [Sphingomonas sp. BE138]MDR6790664.1 putative membrane protein [Sphingomonas sp. BE138]
MPDMMEARSGGGIRVGVPRVQTIDALRGLMIVLMVLDHVRDFSHRTALIADPLDLSTGDGALFATRWITHLCAPTFLVLAGISIWLQQAGGKTGAQLSRFLLTRGLWLILLEFTIVGLGFNLAPWLFFQVLWVLGSGFVAMALLVRLSRATVLVIGILLLLANPVLMLFPISVFAQPFATFGRFDGFGLPGLIAYPLLPWLGLILLGYGIGPLFLRPPEDQARSLTRAASCGAAAFTVLRAPNLYSLDYKPWSVQTSDMLTILDFVDVAKYPPSFLYVVLTLSLSAFLYVLLLARVAAPMARPLGVLGRTALFTYLLHIWVAHLLAVAIGIVSGVPAGAFSGHLAEPSRLIAARWGVGLPATYALWITVLAIMYPLAQRYDRYKQVGRRRWTSYL